MPEPRKRPRLQRQYAERNRASRAKQKIAARREPQDGFADFTHGHALVHVLDLAADLSV
jgi:hypothetical protein